MDGSRLPTRGRRVSGLVPTYLRIRTCTYLCMYLVVAVYVYVFLQKPARRGMRVSSARDE